METRSRLKTAEQFETVQNNCRIKMRLKNLQVYAANSEFEAGFLLHPLAKNQSFFANDNQITKFVKSTSFS